MRRMRPVAIAEISALLMSDLGMVTEFLGHGILVVG
jgi:hypothetical protein